MQNTLFFFYLRIYFMRTLRLKFRNFKNVIVDTHTCKYIDIYTSRAKYYIYLLAALVCKILFCHSKIKSISSHHRSPSLHSWFKVRLAEVISWLFQVVFFAKCILTTGKSGMSDFKIAQGKKRKLFDKCFHCPHNCKTIPAWGRSGVLPYMGYIGMCCCEWYGFSLR